LAPALRTLLVAGGCGFGVWIEWPDLLRPQDFVLSVAYLAVGVALVVTGVLLGAEAAQRANSAMFVAIGLLWLGNDLGSRLSGVLPALGWAVRPLDELLLMVVLLRYPAARITDRLTRQLVPAVMVMALLPYYLSGLLWDPYPDGWPRTFWWPTVTGVNEVAHALWFVFAAAGVLTAGMVVVLAVRRYLRSRGLARRELAPVLVSAAAVAVSYVVLEAVRALTGSEDVGAGLGVSSNLVMLTVPLAFGAAALRRRLDRSAVADLVLGVPQPATVAAVRDALRRVLADPALQVWVWLPDRASYTDGAQTVPVVVQDGRLRREVCDAHGGRLAVVLTDPTLDRRADLVDAAVRAAALSLENARLHAELLARLQEIEQSRTRIVEAGVEQRRRVERDLHDGAQQRLLALAATLGRARTAAADPATLALVEQARTELREALKDLRDLARGIHPAVLEHVGLGAAVDAVAESLPLPVQVSVQTERLAPAVESTAYFVVCEALTNVVKHAHARRASVDIGRSDGTVHLAVSDDGVGGASATAGGGLAGLTDRVAALGGRLQLDSPAGAGTRLRVELPCEY
jgi:signal transduction histidine kinase